MSDLLQRFIFDNTDIRGELVHLEQSYRDVLSIHPYPDVVAALLGEFLAAAALLSATIKFDGILTLQARSDGEIPLIMAEASSDHSLRAIAREAQAASSQDFNTLLTNGQLSITIDPQQGQRYQGIVELNGNNLAQCLEAYFQHSEQLSTRIWLCSNGRQAAGMLLQELPASQTADAELREQRWQHATQLAATVTEQELLTLAFETLLHRLYHREPVRLFAADSLYFKCSCSRARTLDALRTLGQQELETLLAEQAGIDINCEFCHQHYRFTQKDIHGLFQQAMH